MQIMFCEGPPCRYLIRASDGQSLFIQSDFDFPGVAASFGWAPCDCGFTDGTVDCSHRTASAMIADAREFLDGNIGKEVEDPGYFA